ncbi:hypothetical protein [uncultured Methanobrevibacter sp.]|uniref:hypothetical protein n=1 Tax=uncultured Methanobrevibacter sp. TaxID=253161 RepID=UPI0025CC5114|nr:hypothetical protein [uncultured Methanobrevibacter sp.]
MSKYIRKGTCIEINGELYKATDPIEFANCKGCAFNDVCHENSGRISKSDIPYCSIALRRDMEDAIFEKVKEGTIFVDDNIVEGTRLENEIKKFTIDFVRTYDSADIDKSLKRYDSYNKKHEAAQKLKKQINEMKNKLYLLK